MAICATSLPSPKIPNLAFPVSTSLRPKRLACRLSQASLKSANTSSLLYLSFDFVAFLEAVAVVIYVGFCFLKSGAKVGVYNVNINSKLNLKELQQ